MQRGKGGRGDFFYFGDPFAGFSGFSEHRSLMSSFFGKDPFDDSFFTRPFGSMFNSSMIGTGGSLFDDLPNSGFLEHHAPQANKSRGPVIEELSSDDEKGDNGNEGEPNHPTKRSQLGKEPLIEEPDNGIDEWSKHMQNRSDYNRTNMARPQAQTYSFQSSTVTYGGANGAYYTSSTTRRMGGDGVMMEEKKEADTSTGRATHRISRGIHNKGHSVTRESNPDGNVDTVQMLHNLNEDELGDFEEAWKKNGRKHLPGWNLGFNNIDNGQAWTSGGSESGGSESESRGWALPSNETSMSQRRMRSHGARVRIPIQ